MFINEYCDNNINLVKEYVKNQSGGELFMYILIYDQRLLYVYNA